MDSNIKFIREDAETKTLPFLDYVLHIEDDGSLNTEVHRKTIHTQTIICILIHTTHQNMNCPSSELYTIGLRIFPIRQIKKKRNTSTALQTWGYPNLAFVKSATSNLTPPSDRNWFTQRTGLANRN